MDVKKEIYKLVDEIYNPTILWMIFDFIRHLKIK